MDVRFTNVLEGARQYFQGLPTGTNSMVSHPYPSESHRQRNEHEQSREPPPGTGSYWPSQSPETGQKVTSHAGDASRPPSHPEYAQNIPNEHIPHYTGTFHEQYQPQQQQNFQFPRPHSREAPSNNASYQSHIPSSSPYQQAPSSSVKSQSTSMQYQTMSSTYTSNPETASKTSSTTQYQSNVPKSTPYESHLSTIKQPTSSHYQSNSSQYLQPHSPTVKPPQNLTSYLYNGPHSPNVKPPPNTQYQSHIPPNASYRQAPSPNVKQYHQVPSPYHQPPSPYHQTPSPQLPRVPSREQISPRVPSREQPLPRVPSQDHLGPSRDQPSTQYPQASEGYNCYSQSRSYYSAQQPVKSSSNSSSYKTVPTSQPYPAASQQNEVYYKHIYTKQPQSQQQISYASSRPDSEHGIHNSEQAYRATHNLPPIAAISNYHSSRSIRESARPPNTTSNRSRTSSSTYTIPSASVVATNSSSIIQQTPNRTSYNQTITTSNYQDYITNTSHTQSHFQYNTTTNSTQSYNQVVTTCSSNSSSYYSTVNQNPSSNQHYYQQERKSNETRTEPTESLQTAAITSNISDQNLNGRLMPKRESPLDLSVKTVRTPADSTLGDADSEARNKLSYHMSRHTSISTHNYPQLDVNSIHRNLTQRTSQLPTATAPKVEFRPNFNVPSLTQARPSQKKLIDEPKKGLLPEKAHSNSRPTYESKSLYQNINSSRYTSVTVPSAAHVNSFVQAQAAVSNTHPTGAPRMPISNYKSTMYCIPNQDTQKKRPADIPITATPPKQSKIDNWRQSIDSQIEDRLSSYQQQQAKVSTGNKSATMNGAYTSQDRPRDIYSSYQKPNYENAPKQAPFNIQTPYQAVTSHSQTYVPSPMTHQYSNYTSFPPQSHQTGNSYLQPSSRSSSAVSLNTLTNSKHSLGGAVDKRTLSILKNSIEVKGRKKLEQQKSHEHYMQQPRPDVQHPSTDVTAPLQPKPGLIGRNNISPFTPTSFPDNTNMHKFHLPKAIDSVNFDSNKTLSSLEKPTHDTVITNHATSNTEFDGLAAFLAARIRTKGELKQVGNTAQNISNSNVSAEERQQAFTENQMKSPNRQDYISQTSSSGSTVNNSPPKALKERQAFAPRKRLFSRNDEDPSNNSLPARDKSGLRSSSETSVFDFPDSDSENDIGGRESLEAMRKGRRSSKQSSAPLIDIKPESPVKSPPPEDDIFAQVCNNFMEQLKSNPLKNKTKNKKEINSESEITATVDENRDDITIAVKTDFIKTDEIETIDIKENVAEDLKEASKITKIKEEPKDPTVENIDTVILPDAQLKKELEEQQSKSEDPIFVSKQQSVRRRLISSSDSEPDDECKENKGENNIKSESTDIPVLSDPTLIKEESFMDDKLLESPSKAAELLPFIRPAKKPPFGDGSAFYPGWEEEVYKYKKALRMPPSLIQVSRPPQFHRLSTSLPDLDPYPQSPTTSIIPETDKENSTKSKIKKVKSEFTDSDNESNSSFNLFSRKTNYDSEGSASVRSLPNTAKEMSILDRLLEKCGGKKKRKYKRKDDHSPKIVPKAESAVELLPTPSLEIKEEEKDKEIKKLSSSPVIKTESALLGFSKRTINNFKDTFIKKQNNILGVNEQFTTIVLKSRTRKETRVLKQRATIKEVFGEDRPASAPPVTCVNDLQQIKDDIMDESSKLGNLVIKLEKQDVMIEKVKESQKVDIKVDKEDDEKTDTKQVLKNKLLVKEKKRDNNLLKVAEKEVKADKPDDTEDSLCRKDQNQGLEEINQSFEDVNQSLKEANRSLEEAVIKRDTDEKSETLSIDGDEGSVSSRKRTKFGKIRRKLSSGFDYIRKKKKVKKDNNEIENIEKKKRKNVVSKAPESIDDIQKEIKSWVLNKGIGETHLHRAARLGYTDVMAYCLENLQSNASPKDNAGYTPLHVACSRGHLEIAKLLLLYGANPSESAQGGIRPLHEAVENGFVEITRLLLSYGADPSLATYSGMTPLALTNDELTKQFLKNHLDDIEGEVSEKWELYGPSDIFDSADQMGYNVLNDIPEPDPESEEEDIEFEVSEQLLPNVYTLRGEPVSERWVLLQDLSNILKIKSRDALLRQICPPSTSSANISYKSVMRELKMSDFLEQAHCCQFLNAGEKINTRASKIALVKYSEKVRELLGVENVLIECR